MADGNIGGQSEWKKVTRAYRMTRFSPSVKIRRNGYLALNADFVRMAGIEKSSRVSIFLSTDGLRLALRFHDNAADDDAFLLSRDGGGRGSGLAKLVSAPALLGQSETVARLAKEDSRCRSFTPSKEREGMWVLHLIPCFESVLADSMPSGSGIYRYRFGSETVYIGRGCFSERLSDPIRTSWEFDRIEYSVLNDETIERKFEAYWLDEYRERNGRWPIYNKIAASARSIVLKTG